MRNYCVQNDQIKSGPSLGKVIAQTFPFVKRIQVRSNQFASLTNATNKVYFYEGLKKKQPNDNNTFTYEMLPNILMKEEFTVMNTNDDEFCTIKLDQGNMNGTKPIRQVIFHRDLTYTIRIGMYQVPLVKLDIPVVYSLDSHCIIGILTSVHTYRICQGFIHSNHNQRSNMCHIFINPASPSSICRPCVWRKYYVEKKERAETPSVNEVEEDNKLELANEDSADLEDILAQIDPKMAANKEFKCLMESQKMALKCENKRAHRWPRN